VLGDILDTFSDIEKAIQEKFMPVVFGNEQPEDDGYPTLLGLLVKPAGIALPDTTKFVNYKASILVCIHSLGQPLEAPLILAPRTTCPSERNASPNSSATRPLSTQHLSPPLFF
jgi:hypothetical protein